MPIAWNRLKRSSRKSRSGPSCRGKLRFLCARVGANLQVCRRGLTKFSATLRDAKSTTGLAMRSSQALRITPPGDALLPSAITPRASKASRKAASVGFTTSISTMRTSNRMLHHGRLFSEGSTSTGPMYSGGIRFRAVLWRRDMSQELLLAHSLCRLRNFSTAQCVERSLLSSPLLEVFLVLRCVPLRAVSRALLAGPHLRPRPVDTRMRVHPSMQVPIKRTFEIRVRRGWKDGVKITFAEPGMAQEVKFVVRQLHHATFTRRGDDLWCTCELTTEQARDGANVTVPTIDGAPVQLCIKPNSRMVNKEGKKVLAGLGMPNRKRGGKRGSACPPLALAGLACFLLSSPIDCIVVDCDCLS